MNKKIYNSRQHRFRHFKALALAGFIGAGTLLNAAAALAIGPGETGNAPLVSPGGPGEVRSTDNTSSAQSNPNTWKKVNGVYQMPDGSSIEGVLARGIDVSRWQGEIDWKQVASDDVSFVMLGTRSKGAVDPYFHKNIQQASAAGVKVGVYIYSLAMTPQMAVEEANFVLDLIHDYPISYPVAFDMEDSAQGTLSKEQLAEIANAFCKTISDAGYYPMIYANDNWLANKLDMSLMNYPVWVARYSAKPAYQNPVMWQASSTGSVKGINGNVDIDFQFKDFTSVIPANTWRTIGGNTYYYQNYVKQKNGWARDGEDWYYMDSEGHPSKGWITLSDNRYYLNKDNGKMATGWLSDNGKWYYFGGSGALDKGWINDRGTWYYSNEEGVMQTGWLELGGKRYYLEGSGAMAVGWTQQDGKWYYLDSSGAMQKGWINDQGAWYYADSKGVMQTGWLVENGNTYYLKGSGVMASGWREMDGAWYYFDGSGHMAKGMTEVNGLHYYMDPSNGRMAAGQMVDINGTSYQADGNGVLSQVQQEQGEGGTEGQTSGSTTGQTSGGTAGQTPGSTTGQTPGSTTGQTPGSTTEQTPGGAEGQTSGGPAGQMPGQTGTGSGSKPSGSQSGNSNVSTGEAPGSDGASGGAGVHGEGGGPGVKAGS